MGRAEEAEDTAPGVRGSEATLAGGGRTALVHVVDLRLGSLHEVEDGLAPARLPGLLARPWRGFVLVHDERPVVGWSGQHGLYRYVSRKVQEEGSPRWSEVAAEAMSGAHATD